MEGGTDLHGLGLVEMLIAIAIGMGLSLLVIVILLLFTGRSTPRRGSENELILPSNSVFIFDEQRLVTAPREWKSDLETSTHSGSDWQRLRMRLAPRFPGLPVLPELPKGESFRSLNARSSEDGAVLRLRQIGHRLRLTLREPAPPSALALHDAQLRQLDIADLSAVIEHLPIPVWTMNNDGRVLNKNDSYRRLEEQLIGSTDVTAPLVRTTLAAPNQPAFTYRVVLDPRGRLPERWFDVCARRVNGNWQCNAQDVSALVKAEMAQRNFVQTLTKTFSQLSTGLAIFDRDRQLILFNPALVDLTSLSPEFLTSRPSLSQFFDNLRDQQIMPEPKSYSSWREQLNALVTAAADGRYQETWSLASGATYRIAGRPHPNGAVAFLLEDITDEISMTRRFRQQLSLSQSVLDAMTDAIVIFDAQGMMSYCNASYRTLFRIEGDTDLSEVTSRDAHRMWCRNAAAPNGMDELLARLTSRKERENWSHNIFMRHIGELCCQVLPLVSGTCMVTFGTVSKRVMPVETVAE